MFTRDIKDFKALKELGKDEITKELERILSSGATVKQITDFLGCDNSYFYKYLKNQLGYKIVNNQLERVEGFVAPTKTAKPKAAPKQKAAPKEEPKKDIALEVYADVHNTLKTLDMTEYVRTSISFSKSTEDKLKTFLKNMPLCAKQDFITFAIEQALDKYMK